MRTCFSTLSLLSWALLAASSPAPIPQVSQPSPRAPVPRLTNDLRQAGLTDIEDLIRDILSGAQPGQSDEISNKPAICPDVIDPCCVCKCRSVVAVNIVRF
jgi:hypothetical protein